ncbi:MAG: flagellar basal-body MS-ring/collar protein FliF [Myxococcota bacterium]
MNDLNAIIDRARDLWRQASPLGRALGVVGVIAVVLGLGYTTSQSSYSDLVPLAEQSMSLAQVGRITTELEKRQTEFRVTQDGQQVLVPRAQRGDLLATLAASGVSTQPDNSSPLKPGLLATDFQQRELIRQDLERSLARDIASMSAIEWAEVHISPGTDSLFSRRNRRGAASVVVKIKPGFSVPRERALSLKNLVAQAAHRYGVTSNSVTVIDHEARTLAPAEDDSALSVNAKALTLQRETEDDLADRILLLLEPIVGTGRVRVQVRTKMDLDLVEEHAEQYDPDNATVLSERKTSETVRSQRQDAVTAAGTQSNIPQKRVPRSLSGGSRSNRGRAVNETNFVVPKITKHTKHAVGRIQRMSIAVVVDANVFSPQSSVPTKTTNGATQTDVRPSVEGALPAPPNQTMLLALVRDAVAFDETRGDSITLSFQPFIRALRLERAERQKSPAVTENDWSTVVSLLGLALIGLAIFVAYRHRLKTEQDTATSTEADDAESAEGDNDANALPPDLVLKEQVRRATNENLAATVDIIKGWLSTSAHKG